MKQRLLRVTPLLLMAVLLVFIILYEVIIERGGLDGWKYSWLGRFIKLFLFVGVADVVIKLLVNKTRFIWITEILVCLGLFYYWIVS